MADDIPILARRIFDLLDAPPLAAAAILLRAAHALCGHAQRPTANANAKSFPSKLPHPTHQSPS
jgi:hypothetical protein